MINFEILNINDYSRFKPFFNKSPYPLSEYSLTTIFIWNGCIYNVYKAIYKEYLLLAEVNIENENKKALMMPIGNIIPSPTELLEIIEESNFKRYLYVPENYIGQYKEELQKFFDVYEQSGYHDYLYLTKDLSELKGQKYSKKRNLIYQFEKNYIQNRLLEKVTLDRTNVNILKDQIENFENEESDEILKEIKKCEKKAIINAVENWEYYDIFGAYFQINKKIEGFAIGSKLNENTVILNFEKANKKIKGLYQYIDREFAKLAFHYKFINKESDLNKPGLIKAKESYHPIQKIKSYILEKKT